MPSGTATTEEVVDWRVVQRKKERKKAHSGTMRGWEEETLPILWSSSSALIIIGIVIIPFPPLWHLPAQLLYSGGGGWQLKSGYTLTAMYYLPLQTTTWQAVHLTTRFQFFHFWLSSSTSSSTTFNKYCWCCCCC